MNFEDWLKTKGYMDGYGTDYQDAYDEGFDEGVLYQKGEVDKLQAKIYELQKNMTQCTTLLLLLMITVKNGMSHTLVRVRSVTSCKLGLIYYYHYLKIVGI